mgnify:CR=1 FL=1
MVFSIFTGSCNQHHVESQNISSFQTNPVPLTHISPYPSPWQPRIYFLSLWICLFWAFHLNGITQYIGFSIYLWEVNWHTAMVIHFLTVHSCFHGSRVKMNSCDRGHMATKPKIFLTCPFQKVHLEQNQHICSSSKSPQCQKSLRKPAKSCKWIFPITGRLV